MNLSNTRVQNSPTNYYQLGMMTDLNPWGFVFALITTFGIYMGILVIEFLLEIENLFIGK